jgi:amino acid permease
MGEMLEISCVEHMTLAPPDLELVRQQHPKSEQQRISFGARVNDFDSASLRMEEISLESGHQNQDQWLPITQSRKGNLFSSVSLLLSSQIGIQTLLLPLAFAALGWYWGIICTSLAFLWQLYTTSLLVHLHESTPGIRYSRFLHLSITAFGEKLGKILALFPVMYLSGGTSVILIITGGSTMKLFYRTICDQDSNCISKSPSGAQWYLVFACLAILITLFRPNLNSLAGISLIGALTAVGFCTFVWAISIKNGRPDGVSYDPSRINRSEISRVREVLNALGIIALAFRGHNVVLEIQGTLPSNEKQSSNKMMWKGVLVSCPIIAACIFPVAIAGYWTYGNFISTTDGNLLVALSRVHGEKIPKSIMASIYILVIINCVTTFQIYAMVVFDNLEMRYTSSKNQACPKWVRSGIRILFGGFVYFVSVAIPFLGSLSIFIGGLALPLTFSYPCFMWIAMRKRSGNTKVRGVNVVLGCLGVVLSVAIVGGGLWDLVTNGINANFFNPH